MADDPKFVNCCHCRQCQKITGSAFAINGMIEADRISLLQGENKLATSDRQARCTDCNALLWGTHRLFGDGIKFVRIGTLDDAERIVPARTSSSAANILGWQALGTYPRSKRCRWSAIRR